MKKPKVTILVPTIGRMDYLPDTKRCVASQTFSDFKLVVLDNDSPPEAAAFFEQWRREDPRIEIARVSPRVPMFDNFNRGLRACDTELVTFFHDDDVYDSNYLELLVGALDRHPTAAFSGSNYDYVDERGVVTEERRWVRKSELWSGARYLEELVGRSRNPLPMPGLVFRAARFREGFDTSLPIHFGDFVLLMRAAEDGGVAVVSDRVMSIRRHAGQASALVLSRSIALRTEVLLTYLAQYEGRHPQERELVARMRRRVDFARRAALLWGWTLSEDPRERAACLDALGGGATDSVMRGALRWVDRRGLRPAGVGPKLVKVARSAAEALRI